jgi:hypothetical protein
MVKRQPPVVPRHFSWIAVAALFAAAFAPLGHTADDQTPGPGTDSFPVRGFCIAAPKPDGVAAFVDVIERELVPAGINTLVLRVDFNYKYCSHPELRDEDPLGADDVLLIANACRAAGIRVIPQINLLGHQSWEEKLGRLLEVYPEFDETPHIQMPDEYVWPNPDNLYCKSYCPLHPGVHGVALALVDELVTVFAADAFHAGMDEVFYIGDELCPRCSGRDAAELFAGEVTLIRNHLARSGVELWIWGDRLIDGKTTGIGMWEASMNNTHRAIDLIPKDVVINDWHYERPDPTAPYFALKGFRVVACPWNDADVATAQIRNTTMFRQASTPEMRDRFLGVMQTVWFDAQDFLDQFDGRTEPHLERGDPIACVKSYLAEMKSLNGDS